MTSSLRKNFSALTLNNLLTPFFSLALVLAISRLRGAEMLGRYSLMMSVYLVGQGCASLGLNVIVTREVAARREDSSRYFASACLISGLAVTLLGGSAAATIASSFTDIELAQSLLLVLLSLLPTVIMLHGEAILLAFERTVEFVSVALVENSLRALIAVGLVAAGYGLAAIALTLLALRAIAAIALLFVLRRQGVALRRASDFGLARALVGYVPVLGSITAIQMVSVRADVFLLSTFGTWTDVGLYTAAMRFVDLARTVPQAYAKAFYPILSRMRHISALQYAGQLRAGLRGIVLLIVPGALALAGIAPALIPFLYGPDLAPASASLAILAWSLIPATVAIVLGQALFSYGLQAADLLTNAVAIVANVGLNLYLIPRFGHVGAAMACLISTTLYAALQYYWTRLYVTDIALLWVFARIVCIAALSYAVVAMSTSITVPGSVFVGVVLLVGGAAITGVISNDDWHKLRESLPPLRFRRHPRSTGQS